jgi:hypothetical protein
MQSKEGQEKNCRRCSELRLRRSASFRQTPRASLSPAMIYYCGFLSRKAPNGGFLKAIPIRRPVINLEGG